ncbi:hypothetical protein ALC57_04310 [Trachymyrmex cornetzi]|uniref:Uncharacterized protein n=1 Tax=Trachymyrmex cornetzi TaxID=471704 RepID=A0A195EEA4_9HYME|nr:hypothetical protein ALC57_04310 [Trachymyrmex cornetzi]
MSAQKRLMCKPSMTGKIINAYADMHNVRIAHGIQDVELDEIDNENLHHRLNIDHKGRISRTNTCRIQKRFIVEDTVKGIYLFI